MLSFFIPVVQLQLFQASGIPLLWTRFFISLLDILFILSLPLFTSPLFPSSPLFLSLSGRPARGIQSDSDPK